MDRAGAPGQRRAPRVRAPPAAYDVRMSTVARRDTVEREAKLEATAGLVLPDLAGLAPGVRPVALEDERLVATYFDTADLRLARAGVTVRHRVGEPGGPVWTVKLPAGASSTALSRRELTLDAPEGRVPEVVADLVLAARRHEPLAYVARLETLRRRVRLVDAEGRPLCEVADDTVVAHGAPATTGAFREVEVELVGEGPAAGEVMAAAVATLVGAGCTTSRPIAKLARALGDAALLPPDVVVPDVARDATAAELVRHALSRSVAGILRHDPGVRLGGDEEEVHDFRVSTRRLRSDLRSFSALLDRSSVAPVSAELRWLGALVGAVRDADVLAGRLAADVALLPPGEQHAARGLADRIERDASSARGALLAAMRSARYVDLLDSLVALVASPPLAADASAARAPGSKIVRSVVRPPWRRLARAARALGDAPSDEALHEVRILAKRCRYAAEAVAPVAGPEASRFASSVAALQSLLGDHQDAVVARAWFAASSVRGPLDASSPDDSDAATAARLALASDLVALEDGRRASLRARWADAWAAASDKRLRSFL